MPQDKGWICPVPTCRAWNPSTRITCVNTPEHDGGDD